MKLSGLEFGVKITNCDECSYKNNESNRDVLLVTAGSRAAYMHDANIIDLPEGVDGEYELAMFISHMVDIYLHIDTDTNYDMYIETVLKQAYGK